MKKGTFLGLAMLLFATSLVQAQEQKVRPFSNVAVGVNVGLSGFGVSIATPLCSHISLRGGYSPMPIGFKYTSNDLDLDIPHYTGDVPDMSMDLKGKLKMNTGHVIFDFAPFKHGQSSFFIAAGAYFGSNTLLTVSGQLDEATRNTLRDLSAQTGQHIDPSDLLLSVGDTRLRMDPDGSVSADLKVFKVRPYVGLGFGRAIPKHRVGFRFELGAMFHGVPTIESDHIVDIESSADLDQVNKFLKNFKVYPQLSFHLTVRLLKNK